MVKIPLSFKPLTVPLPPMLLELVGVSKDMRFVALYYWYGKPTWSDSKTCTSFPFYTVWQPYTQHRAITHQLVKCHLGWDEQESTHALVCDRAWEKVYVAPFGEAVVFLNSQQEQTQSVTIQHWENIKAQALAYTPVSFERMREVGMFEMFLAPAEEQKQKALEMVAWLYFPL